MKPPCQGAVFSSSTRKPRGEVHSSIMRLRTIIPAAAACMLVMFALTAQATTLPEEEPSSEAPLGAEETLSAMPAELYPTDEYMLGRVVSIIEESTESVEGREQTFQTTRVEILKGKEAGREVEITQAGVGKGLKKGDK